MNAVDNSSGGMDNLVEATISRYSRPSRHSASVPNVKSADAGGSNGTGGGRLEEEERQAQGNLSDSDRLLRSGRKKSIRMWRLRGV